MERAAHLREHWNPHDSKQLFWIDDAFGAMQYESSRAHEWNATFPWLDVAIKSGAKVIITSRTYIYSHARRELKQSAFPLLEEAQVVVDVSDLKPDERDQILYNHVRLGNQPWTWRRAFKQFFDLVSRHEQFKPEIARRLGDIAYTKNLTLSSSHVADFVATPEDFLRQTIEGLSDDDRSALAAIFIRGGRLTSPVVLTEAEMQIIARLGGTYRGITAGLIALQGSFVRATTLDEQVWTFNHPTIGDAFASLIAGNPELVDLYIAGAAVPKLMDEVTCGRVGMQGVKVVVPASRFDLVIRRLHSYTSAAGPDIGQRRRRSYEFLSSRCSRAFLERYIDATPDFWRLTLNIGSYLAVDSEFALVMTLRRHGLLSEENVRAVIAQVKALAVDTPDADFLTVDRIRQFFTAEELDEITTHVEQELVPRIRDVIADWKLNYSESDDADEHSSSLLSAFEAFRDYFSGRDEVKQAFARAADRVESMISEYAPPEPDYDDYDDEDRPRLSPAKEEPAERHIYDDIDA